MQDIKAHLTVEHIQSPLWYVLVVYIMGSEVVSLRNKGPNIYTHGSHVTDKSQQEMMTMVRSMGNLTCTLALGFRSEWTRQHCLVVFCLLVYSLSPHWSEWIYSVFHAVKNKGAAIWISAVAKHHPFNASFLQQIKPNVLISNNALLIYL